MLGYYSLHYHRNYEQAKTYFQQAINYSVQTKSLSAGYYVSSLIGLGRIAELEKDVEEAQRYYKLALDKAERKSSQHADAQKALDGLKKSRRDARRSGQKNS